MKSLSRSSVYLTDMLMSRRHSYFIKGAYFHGNFSSCERSISRYRIAGSPERTEATLTLHETWPSRPTPGIPGWLSTDPHLFSRILLPTRSAANATIGRVPARTGGKLWQARGREQGHGAPDVRTVPIPHQDGATGASPLGTRVLPVAQGVVRWFDLNAGIGMIAQDGSGEDVFFHFTALPGQSYRTIRPGTPVKFEVVEGKTGPAAGNVQKSGEHTL